MTLRGGGELIGLHHGGFCSCRAEIREPRGYRLDQAEGMDAPVLFGAPSVPRLTDTIEGETDQHIIVARPKGHVP